MLFSKSQLIVYLLIISISSIVASIQLYGMHTAFTAVGFVDAWPLYDRLMRYEKHDLSLLHYLFDPHVHPHLIVYLIYLIDFLVADLRQIIPYISSTVSILLLSYLLIYTIYKTKYDIWSNDLRSASLYGATLVLTSGLSEATLIPFQTVVLTSRLFYVSLFAIIIYSHYKDSVSLYISGIILSSIAVAFYASGGLFALEMILVNLLFFRRWKRLVASFLPLASYVSLVAIFIHPSLETHALKSIIFNPSLETIINLAVGVSSYYATGFVSGWPLQLDAVIGRQEEYLLIIGFSVCLITVIWSLIHVYNMFIRHLRGDIKLNKHDVTACLMSVVSLFVFASSVSASLLWSARAIILGPGTSIFYSVLGSTRYSAFSSLASLTLLYIVSNIKYKYLSVLLTVSLFVFYCYLGLNSSTGTHLQSFLSVYRDKPEIASAALLVGFNPTDPEGIAVWPGVSDDWFWPGELPRVVTFLNTSNLAYAHGLPLMGSGKVSSWPTTQIVDYVSEKTASKPNLCHISGLSTNFKSSSKLFPIRLHPISINSGIIVGFAVQNNDLTNGYIICQKNEFHPDLFISDVN